MVGIRGEVVVGRGEVVLNKVKGLTRTVGGNVVGPSSVMGRVGEGLANREFWGGLVTTGGGWYSQRGQ